MEKTHYRKVFKSDHLGVADLEEFLEENKKLIFTIKEVRQEYNIMVAGRKGNHNIAYFKEKIKPLVLNATNSKLVKKFNKNSPFVEDWINTVVELYIDYNVRMKGDTVGGVRIKPTQPKITKENLTPSSKRWSKAVEYVKENKSIDNILKQMNVSIENQKKLKDESGLS